MTMLLAFAQFIAFAIIDRLLGSVTGLLAGAAVATALLIRDLAIADVIQSAAFFNWANRLMLSLGEPAAPAQA